MIKRGRTLVLSLFFTVFMVTMVYAESDIKVVLDNKEVVFDQPPVIENGRTLVPVRAIAEALGAQVGTDYNSDGIMTISIIKDSDTIILAIGSSTASVNGKAVQLDVPANIIGGRTLVPIRFISETFNLTVGWDEGVIEIKSGNASVEDSAANTAVQQETIPDYTLPSEIGLKSYNEIAGINIEPLTLTGESGTQFYVYSYENLDFTPVLTHFRAYTSYLVVTEGFEELESESYNEFFVNLDTGTIVSVTLDVDKHRVVIGYSLDEEWDANGSSNVKNNGEYTLGSTIIHDGMEITFGSKVEFVKIDNRYSDLNGETVVKVPATVKNISSDTRGLNMFRYEVFGSKGTTVSTSVTAYFDEGVDYIGKMRPNATGKGYYYFLYDGNGDYYMSFRESILIDPIEVRIPVKK